MWTGGHYHYPLYTFQHSSNLNKLNYSQIMAKTINYDEMWLARLHVDADQIFKIKFSQIITITNNAGSELII